MTLSAADRCSWVTRPVPLAAVVAILTLCTPAEAQRLKNGPLRDRPFVRSDCQGCDLQGADFRNADLSSADFSGADLRGADLTGAEIDRITLDGADLRGVIGWAEVDLGLGIKANRANFSGTDLRGSRVCGGYSGGYFEQANFTDADLTGATLSGRFHGARFDGAILNGTVMLGAHGLESIREDLRAQGAIVIGEDFAKAVRSGRDFSGYLLRGVRLQDADLAGAQLKGADLKGAHFDRAQLTEADLREARLLYGTAVDARFDRADLSGAFIYSLDAAGASFRGARLKETNLARANLAGTVLRDADLTGADLKYADLTGADLTGAILDDIEIDAAILVDVQGLDPETERLLKKRAGRWSYELLTAIDRFVKDFSLSLHLLLAPTAALVACAGLQSSAARYGYVAFITINLASVVPLLARLILAVLGGSPTAQMSHRGLWSIWFYLWPVLMLSLLALLVASLAAGGYHIAKHVVKRPRDKPLLSIACSVLTAANCFFAFASCMSMVPDA